MGKWSGGFNPKFDWHFGEEEAYGARVGGTGSASVLPMEEDDLERERRRKRQPLGFVVEPKPERKRKA